MNATADRNRPASAIRLTIGGTFEKSSTRRSNKYGMAMIRSVATSVTISTCWSPNVVTSRDSTMAMEIAPKKRAMSTLVLVRRRTTPQPTSTKINK